MSSVAAKVIVYNAAHVQSRSSRGGVGVYRAGREFRDEDGHAGHLQRKADRGRDPEERARDRAAGDQLRREDHLAPGGPPPPERWPAPPLASSAPARFGPAR